MIISQYIYYITGTQALDYVKNYAEATSQWEGFPIQVDVPRSDILLGKSFKAIVYGNFCGIEKKKLFSHF